MKTRAHLLIAVPILFAVVLSACSKVSIPNVSGLQNAGSGISAAAAKCSEASGKISDETQTLLAAIKSKDTAAAQAAGQDLATTATELKQSETDGLAAAQGLSNLPAGGDQAVAGVTAAFKICGATGDYAAKLATQVASAKGQDAYNKLEQASNQLSDQASKAANEANSAASSG
jgi:hypothetical protein